MGFSEIQRKNKLNLCNHFKIYLDIRVFENWFRFLILKYLFVWDFGFGKVPKITHSLWQNMHFKRYGRKLLTITSQQPTSSNFRLARSYREILLAKKYFAEVLMGNTVHSQHASFSIDNKLYICTLYDICGHLKHIIPWIAKQIWTIFKYLFYGYK